jgi:hypothetical protein
LKLLLGKYPLQGAIPQDSISSVDMLKESSFLVVDLKARHPILETYGSSALGLVHLGPTAAPEIVQFGKILISQFNL